MKTTFKAASMGPWVVTQGNNPIVKDVSYNVLALQWGPGL